MRYEYDTIFLMTVEEIALSSHLGFMNKCIPTHILSFHFELLYNKSKDQTKEKNICEEKFLFFFIIFFL